MSSGIRTCFDELSMTTAHLPSSCSGMRETDSIGDSSIYLLPRSCDLSVDVVAAARRRQSRSRAVVVA